MSPRRWASSLVSLAAGALMIAGSLGRWFSLEKLGLGPVAARGTGLVYDGERIADFPLGWSAFGLGIVVAALSLGLLTRIRRLLGTVVIAAGIAAVFVAVTVMRHPESLLGDSLGASGGVWPSPGADLTVSWGLVAVLAGGVAAVLAGIVAVLGGRVLSAGRWLTVVAALALGLLTGWILDLAWGAS